MAVSHIKSDTIADFTGTITGFNSQGSTTTIAATDLVRPSDWNSAHNQFYTLTGNTTGNSTASGTNVIFAGSGGISLGGSTGTLVISAPTPMTFSGYDPYPDRVYVIGQPGQGSLFLDPDHLPNLQFDRVQFFINNTNSSNSSGSHTLSFWVGLYTRNDSSLSLHASSSTTIGVTHSGTAGSYSWYSGLRMATMGWTTTITENKYWIAFLSRTTSGGANGSYSNWLVSHAASAYSGRFGTANTATFQVTLGQGYYSTTTSSLPGSIAFSQITGTDTFGMRFPYVAFGSGTA